MKAILVNPQCFFKHGIHASLLYLERTLNQRAQIYEELQYIHSCRIQNRFLTFLSKFPYYPHMEKCNKGPEQLTDADVITSINQYFLVGSNHLMQYRRPIKTQQLFSAMASCINIKNKHWSFSRRETISGTLQLQIYQSLRNSGKIQTWVTIMVQPTNYMVHVHLAIRQRKHSRHKICRLPLIIIYEHILNACIKSMHPSVTNYVPFVH